MSRMPSLAGDPLLPARTVCHCVRECRKGRSRYPSGTEVGHLQAKGLRDNGVDVDEWSGHQVFPGDDGDHATCVSLTWIRRLPAWLQYSVSGMPRDVRSR